MNHEGGKLWRRWKGRVELLPSKLFQILMPYQVQEVRTVLEAEIGKNTEGGDGSSYPTAPRCTCRSATARRVGR